MDSLSNFSSINPAFSDDVLLPFSAAQAQQLLHNLGWTYYTLWKKDTAHNPLVSNAPGLVWSQGDVNRSLLIIAEQNDAYATTSRGYGTESPQISKEYKMGYLLQQFYKNCSFLPSGLGIAGVAMASGRYQWTNSGEELFKQISSLSTYNRHHVPSDLQDCFFETVVCIPLQNGAGVLEMGTKTLVAENEDMLQMLGSVDGLATGTQQKRELDTVLNPALNSGSMLIPASYKAGQYFEHGEQLEEHNVDTIKAMIYGGRNIQQSSISSSYCSSSSATSSPRAGTTLLFNPSPIPSMTDEDMLTSMPATSLQATINQQLDILNQLHHIGFQHTAGNDPPISIPAFGDQQLNPNAHLHGAASHASPDDFYSSNRVLYCSTTHVASSPPLASPPPQHDTRPQNFHLHRGNQQQYQWYEQKMIDSSGGESTAQESLTDFPNILLASTSDAGSSSGADKDKEMEKLVAAAISNVPGGFIAATTRNKKPFYDKGEQLKVGFSTAVSTKPAAAGSFHKNSAGLEAKDDDQLYTASKMEQEGGKDQYNINLQLGAVKDLYINMQLNAGYYGNKPQDAAAAAHVLVQQGRRTSQLYAGNMGSAAAGPAASSTPQDAEGAFKSWRRSLLAVNSYQKKQKQKQKQITARDSFLKRLLVHYLPRQHRESMVRIEHRMRTGAAAGISLIGYAQDMRRTSSLLNIMAQGKLMEAGESPQTELAAVNHMYAERNRRRKQAECYEALRNLVPNIAKKDKVALLERSIQYLKELKGRVFELDQEKAALMLINNEDNKDAIRSSSIHTSSQAIATCSCLPPSMFKDGNYFHLNIKQLSIKHKDTNMTNIDILSALQRKNLHCIKFKSEFEKGTRKIDIEILAKYEDGDNCTLGLDGIQEIQEWWPTFVENFEIDKP